MSDTSPTAASMPGYRRRIVIDPGQGTVRAMLEDDMHCMAVTLHHDGGRVSAIEPVTKRAPWDTCPGAVAKLVETFAGAALSEVTARRDKKQNCTHLHDLAVLAAAHAVDDAATTYDIAASDPDADGERLLEIRRNGVSVHTWRDRAFVLLQPEAIAGQNLLALRDWIATLAGTEQEAARLLQWAAIVAHGRIIPIERQSVAADLPPNCWSFQPERALHARRIGLPLDFSAGSRELLGGLGAG